MRGEKQGLRPKSWNAGLERQRDDGNLSDIPTIALDGDLGADAESEAARARKARNRAELGAAQAALRESAQRGANRKAEDAFWRVIRACGRNVLHDRAHCVRAADEALIVVEDAGMGGIYLYNQRVSQCAREAGAGDAAALDRAFGVLSRMVERGVEPDLVTFNALLNVCAKSAGAQGDGVVRSCFEVLAMMDDVGVQPDTITFTTLLDAATRGAGARGGRGGWTRGWQIGMDVLDRMRAAGVPRNIRTYNVLIAACARAAETRRAGPWIEQAVQRGLSVLALIRADDLVPDDDTFNHLFAMCAKAAGAGFADVVPIVLELLDEVPAAAEEPGVLTRAELSVATYNALLNVMAKAAMVDEANKVVAAMRAAKVEPDAVTWNTLMHAVANEAATGRVSGVQAGLEVLAEMRAAGFAPSTRVYNAFLRACTASGWGRGTDSVVEQGKWVTELMRQDGVRCRPGPAPRSSRRAASPARSACAERAAARAQPRRLHVHDAVGRVREGRGDGRARRAG
jgi:pentatricopeptide repeat protein